MIIQNLGHLDYRSAWVEQEKAHADVLAGGSARILFVEHPPVITFGRRDGGERHLIGSDEQLQKLEVEVVKSDRGGDITFHGPGQLVAYPILRLNAFGLSVGGYVHRLEDAVIAYLAELKIPARKDPKAVGVWINDDGRQAKICAIGVRVSRGVTLHGLALNVTTDLKYFDLIVPCGLPGKPVTSLQKLLGSRVPAMKDVMNRLGDRLVSALNLPSPATPSAP